MTDRPESIPVGLVDSIPIRTIYTMPDGRTREAEVLVPDGREVLKLIERAAHAISSRYDAWPEIVLVGWRWYLALENLEGGVSNVWSCNQVYADPYAETGVKLLGDPERDRPRWFAPRARTLRGEVPIEIREMARDALNGDDMAREVLADWYESQGDVTNATALRAPPCAGSHARARVDIDCLYARI